MKHPRMTRNVRVAATVPALSGGLNAAVKPSLIGDTALSDVCDMVYRDGVLHTRRGFVTSAERYSPFSIGSEQRFFADRDGYLLVLACNDNEGSGEVSVSVFDPDGRCTDTSFTLNGPFGLNGFFVPAGEISLTERYTALLFLNDGTIYGLHAADGVCNRLDEDAYIPTYAVNGTPKPTRTERAVIGDRAEPFNALSPYFRCTYSADGEGIYYAMPRVYQSSAVTVTVARPNGTQQTFTVNGGIGTSDPVDGYVLHCDRAGGCFWFTQNGVPCAMPSNGMHNHITVHAMHDMTGFPTVTHMTSGVWFADGRLFLAGDHHVMWSAAGNPLYFPVTAYAAVGSPDEPITALGVQGEQLVVFKKRSLYAVTPQKAETPSADEVMRGETVDVTATALFAVTPLHVTVGCDLPYTVQVFGNRLTWACSDGTVYTLGTGSALAQRTVSVISDAVRPLLRAGAPALAAATVCDGQYWLLWDNTVLMAEDEREPRWTRFSFASTRAQALCLCTVRGTVAIPAAYTVGNSTVMFYFRADGATDTAVYHTGTGWHDAVYAFTAVPVRGMCCTKQFDFGTPETVKRITRVFAEVSAAGAVDIAYVTERGTAAELPHIPCDGLRLTPHLTRCRRTAIRFSGEALQVGSITLHVTERR